MLRNMYKIGVVTRNTNPVSDEVKWSGEFQLNSIGESDQFYGMP